MGTQRTPQCGECGSVNVVPIVFGYPGPEMWKTHEAGEIQLGGCIVTGNDPDWHCKDCGHQWVDEDHDSEEAE